MVCPIKFGEGLLQCLDIALQLCWTSSTAWVFLLSAYRELAVCAPLCSVFDVEPRTSWTQMQCSDTDGVVIRNKFSVQRFQSFMFTTAPGHNSLIQDSMIWHLPCSSTK